METENALTRRSRFVGAMVSRAARGLSLEYAVLKLLTPGYKPEPWQPLNTLTWAKAMAWNLGEGQLDYEVQHAILSKTLTSD